VVGKLQWHSGAVAAFMLASHPCPGRGNLTEKILFGVLGLQAEGAPRRVTGTVGNGCAWKRRSIRETVVEFLLLDQMP